MILNAEWSKIVNCAVEKGIWWLSYRFLWMVWKWWQMEMCRFLSSALESEFFNYSPYFGSPCGIQMSCQRIVRVGAFDVFVFCVDVEDVHRGFSRSVERG